MAVLWASQTFNKPVGGWADGDIIGSVTIVNNSVDPIVRTVTMWETLTPDGEDEPVGYSLGLRIEEEVETGVWVYLAETLDQFNTAQVGVGKPTTIILEVSPLPAQEPLSLGNTDLTIVPGVGVRDVRLSLVYFRTNTSLPELDAVTLSAYSRTSPMP